ncbi:MAG TPA: hypothetical protein VGP25_00645 [Gemmatimonadaceae bacterium]|nr:hypothetical protein [Gemmatimonadaceae bacterium]
MTSLRWPTLAALIAVAAMSPNVTAAQGETTPRPGDRVEFRIAGPDGAPVGLLCDGRVAAVVRDTIVLGHSATCPPGAYAGELRIARDDRGSRLGHMGLGLLGGALVGGVLARVAAGDGCVIDGCDEGGFAVGVITLAGTATGALIGTVVGAVLPAGTQWLTERAPRSLRVAGLDIHPQLRVSFGERHRH